MSPTGMGTFSLTFYTELLCSPSVADPSIQHLRLPISAVARFNVTCVIVLELMFKRDMAVSLIINQMVHTQYVDYVNHIPFSVWLSKLETEMNTIIDAVNK